MRGDEDEEMESMVVVTCLRCSAAMLVDLIVIGHSMASFLVVLPRIFDRRSNSSLV